MPAYGCTYTGDLNVAYSAVDVYDGRYNKKRNQGAGFTDAERLAMGRCLSRACDKRHRIPDAVML